MSKALRNQVENGNRPDSRTGQRQVVVPERGAGDRRATLRSKPRLKASVRCGEAGSACPSGAARVFGTRWGRWLYSAVRAQGAAEVCALKWLILGHVIFHRWECKKRLNAQVPTQERARRRGAQDCLRRLARDRSLCPTVTPQNP